MFYHKPEKDLVCADALSRMAFDEKARETVASFIARTDVDMISVLHDDVLSTDL